MGQQEIKHAIEGAIDYLTKNPAEAKYTDSYATARLESADSLKVHVSGPENAHLMTDMPTSIGGTNSTPSAGWYFRAAEASAAATLIAMRAAQLGVRLDEVEVTVDSQSDDWGILGIGDVAAGPLATRVAVKVRADSVDKATLEELVRWALEHTPVLDAVRRAIPMTIEVDAGS